MSEQNASLALKKLLNKSEKRTEELLNEACSRSQARVYAKVRLADVFPIEQSDICRELYSFSLRSHFDFLVTNMGSDPLFAVEFDGVFHRDPKQVERDQKKDYLCKLFSLPLLRINSNYLVKKYRGIDLVNWFTEVWFLREGFFEAQESGNIPYDEVFDPCSFVSIEGLSAKQFPLWISLEKQLKMQRLHEPGRCKDRVPSVSIFRDKLGTYHAIGYMLIDNERGVLIKSGMRAQMFPGCQIDLLEGIVVCEVYDALIEILEGVRRPNLPSEIDACLRGYSKRYNLAMCICTCNGVNSK
jgi:hypothetical protein